jgi:hypothetical protein
MQNIFPGFLQGNVFTHRRTSRPLEVRIKEHKYNLTQGLLENSKNQISSTCIRGRPQNMLECSEGLAD